MFIRKYSLPLSVFIVVIAGVGIYLLSRQPRPAPILIYNPVEVEKPTEAPKPPPPGASANGHWHGEEWHDAPHEPPETAPAAPVVSAGQSYIPEGAVVTPNFPAVDPSEDPVAAAYKRLEYIKNNPYAWGGVHSERATELIAVLLPPPEPVDHNEGDELSTLMYELTLQGDPRAAEVIIANICDGYIGGTGDALVEIGPPAVPYILPYLERGITEAGRFIYIRLAVFRSLSGIGVRYRDDLGGIVDHIIIPKFQEIAADENNERYANASVIHARKALSRLVQ